MKHVFVVTVAALLTALPVHSASAQSKLIPLRNADVVRLAALGVSDQTVIAVINGAKVTQLDLSPGAVGNLATSGVSTAVIAAMRHPSTPTQPTAATARKRAAASSDRPNAADRIEQAADRLERATLDADNRWQQWRNQESLDRQLFTVESVDFRVTEKNNVCYRFGWIAIVRNGGAHGQPFDLTVQFLDKDGFVVDSDRAHRQAVDAFETRTLTGETFVSLPGALRVAQVKATATREQ